VLIRLGLLDPRWRACGYGLWPTDHGRHFRSLRKSDSAVSGTFFNGHGQPRVPRAPSVAVIAMNSANGQLAEWSPVWFEGWREGSWRLFETIRGASIVRR